MSGGGGSVVQDAAVKDEVGISAITWGSIFSNFLGGVSRYPRGHFLSMHLFCEMIRQLKVGLSLADQDSVL